MEWRDARCLTSVVALVLACEPLHDLDAASRGPADGVEVDSAATASSPNPQPEVVGGSAPTSMPVTHPASGGASNTPLGPGAEPTTTTDVVGPSEPVPSPSASASTAMGGPDPSPTAVEEPMGAGGEQSFGGDAGAPSDDGAGGSAAGGSAAGGSAGNAGGTAGSPNERPYIAVDEDGDAAELPIDLVGSPVSGTFTVSTEAEWEVEGTFLPTFEIKTPSASYWLVKSLGQIVSIVDAHPDDQRQWIDFSSGFRPLRNLPSFGSLGASEGMTTTLDADTQTPTHLRLHAVSDSGSWRLVYDFYPTHVTITVNAAPTPYGMAYRGVPGGALDAGDRLMFADGTLQDALLSSVIDLPGPFEWLALSDSVLGRSMFLLQHGDDATSDLYQVKDNDSSMVSFGDGELLQLPMRFSFGLVDSAEHAAVASRVEFVIAAIRQ